MILAGMWLMLAAALIVASSMPSVVFELQMLSLFIGVACAAGGFSVIGQVLAEWWADRRAGCDESDAP